MNEMCRRADLTLMKLDLASENMMTEPYSQGADSIPLDECYSLNFSFPQSHPSGSLGLRLSAVQ
jgi:hypothetical protein